MKNGQKKSSYLDEIDNEGEKNAENNNKETNQKIHPKLKELRDWLKTLLCYLLPRVSCGSECLPKECIQDLEKRIDSYEHLQRIF
jgi:hypothetical protein